MKALLIATTNPGKFSQLSDALKPLDLALRSLADMQEADATEVEENGKTAQDNAQIKATAYAQQLNIITLAMDNGLYLKGLDDALQPGIYVRRIYGEGNYPRPSDIELLAYYSGLIAGLGGKANGHWEFAVCIATPTGQIFETTLIQPRGFVSKPSLKIVSGYPIESLQIDPKTGKYIAEMTNDEKSLFWQALIGEQLCTFVQETLERISDG
jgi:inosine/xanthosine triphosphate pyrophosphatase family protein